ncbi:MAG: hypothetical protein E7641_06985 [Ruminococcaceae bacterium]|nr:hypothetical protein [Oscillospiraceae bacterium]
MTKKKKTKKKGANWGVPKNAAAYFDPSYDYPFRDKHPILYLLTVIAVIVGVMIGPALYIYLCWLKIQSNIALDSFNLFFWIIGFISSFGISIGFCNLFMIIHKQYLGHYVTIGSFIIGVVGSAIGLLFL